MPHPPPDACNPADHALTRRLFLGGAELGGFGRLFAADHAARAAAQRKHVVLVFMSGGPSQFETWNPKTGRPTGGPHLSQQTSVPGIRFDEYMPNLSRLARRMATVRSMTSDLGDHMEGHYLAQTGHKPTSVVAAAPHWLSVAAHERPAVGDVPGYVVLGSEQGGNMAVPGAGFLGAGFQGLFCPGRGRGPEDLPADGPQALAAFRRREELRRGLSRSFADGRATRGVEGHEATFAAVERLLRNRDLFDVSKEPARLSDRYGPTALGRDCLLARRLVERGVPFVRVLVCAHDAGWVRGFAVSPDGRFVYTGGSDRRLKRWPWAGGLPADAADHDVEAHAGWVEAVAVSPDGRHVVTTGADGLVKVWDAELKPLRTLTGHTDFVRDAAWAPDDRVFVTGAEDGRLLVWDGRTFERLREIVFGDANEQFGQPQELLLSSRLVPSR